MQSSFWNYSIFLVGLTSLLASSRALAHDQIGTYRRPVCPPYCSPCYGYYQPTWRPWPTECERPPAAVIEAAPAPSAAKPQTLREKPAKDKKETVPPENVPPPKRDDSQSRRSIDLPAPAAEQESKPTMPTSSLPRAWDPWTGRLPGSK